MPTETTYNMKAAKINAPINTARATAMSAKKNLAIRANARLALSLPTAPRPYFGGANPEQNAFADGNTYCGTMAMALASDRHRVRLRP